jgi:hypothetical protein
MKREEGSRPISALEGTWPLDEWPVDVQRVDENGVDLSLIEYTLSQSPAERLAQLEECVASILSIRGSAWSDSTNSSND